MSAPSPTAPPKKDTYDRRRKRGKRALFVWLADAVYEDLHVFAEVRGIPMTEAVGLAVGLLYGRPLPPVPGKAAARPPVAPPARPGGQGAPTPATATPRPLAAPPAAAQSQTRAPKPLGEDADALARRILQRGRVDARPVTRSPTERPDDEP